MKSSHTRSRPFEPLIPIGTTNRRIEGSSSGALETSERRVRSAFTLIELLVVISIIAILAAMLLPALSQARRKAMLTITVANSKSLSTAMMLYASEDDEHLPPGRLSAAHDYVGWDDFLDPYLGNALSEADKRSESPPEQPYFAVYECPLDNLARTYGNGLTRTFQVNGHTAPNSPRLFAYNAESGVTSMRLTQVEAPTSTIMLNEQAKSSNPVGSGSNTLMIGNDLLQVTTSVVLSGNVQYNPNHHQNNFRNVLAFVDGHSPLTFMPSTRDNGDWLWRTNKP